MIGPRSETGPPGWAMPELPGTFHSDHAERSFDVSIPALRFAGMVNESVTFPAAAVATGTKNS